MNKAYLKYQLKRWLPLFIVMALVTFSISMLAATLTSAYSSYHWLILDNQQLVRYGRGYDASQIYWAMFIPSLLFALFLPLVGDSYRFYKSAADAFYSAPMKEGDIRKSRHLLLLCMLLIAFTFSFWMAVLVYGLRVSYVTLPDSTNPPSIPVEGAEGTVFFRPEVHYWGFLVMYAFCLLALLFQYGYSCFWSKLANDTGNAIMMIVLSTFLLMCIPFVFVEIPQAHSISFYRYLNPFILGNLSPIFEVFIIHRLCSCLINYGKFAVGFGDSGNTIYGCFTISLFLVLGILSVLDLFLGRERKGEDAGSITSPTRLSKGVVVGVFTIANFIYPAQLKEPGSYFTIIVLAIVLTAGCYIFLAILNRRLKLSKKELLLPGIVIIGSLLAFTFNLACILISRSNSATAIALLL